MKEKSGVNPIIWDEVDRFNMDEVLRSFIEKLLLFERKHIHEKRPRYSEEYDRIIEGHSREYGGDDENENS